MNDQALIVAEMPKLPPVKLSEQGAALRNAALELSAFIGRVSNAQENENAVEAQSALKNASNLLEKARTEITKPLLDAQRRIKAAVDAERKELEGELLRVSRLIGDFQSLELQKQRAAEAARQAEASRLERERMEALSKAKTHDQVDAIKEHFDNRAAIESTPPPEPVRADGQVVRTDWEITRINEMQLARARPDLVRKIDFDMRAIKLELTKGTTLPGVEAREIVKSQVRTNAVKAIDV